jgi:hypothetical protein
MLLTMRPTGGHSPVYADRQDWTILDDGKPVGRIYEHAGAGTPADRRCVSRAQNQVRRCLMLRGLLPGAAHLPAGLDRNTHVSSCVVAVGRRRALVVTLAFCTCG